VHDAFVTGAGAGVVSLEDLELVSRRKLTPVRTFGK
jgi:hypothetical protein